MDVDNIIALSFFAACWVLVIVAVVKKLIKNKYAPTRRVQARVVDKHTTDFFSKYAANSKRVRYVVTFAAAGKRLSFYVSPWTYNGYRINDTGTLTYKGDRIIDFR